MKYKKFQDIQLSTLGMGNMRLPLIDPKNPDKGIDYVGAHEIIDHAFASGINYFDTAYIYNKGDSEKCLGAAMKKFPRDQFYMATKFNLAANPDYKAVFEEELERLQTDHIDFYLLHCIMDGNAQKYIDSGCIAFFEEQKRLGRISYLGFSSHAGVDTLRMFASLRDWDFAQIQLNYYDWLFGSAKEEYEILAERNIPIVVMEPVRGGRLADLTPETNAILKDAHPDWSIASWALRFVKSQPAVQVILSGMSTVGQLDDNLVTFDEEGGLSDDDMKTLIEVANQFKSQIQVPCTACRYCCADCPMQINIPEYLKVYNNYKVEGEWALGSAKKIESEGKPADCIGCGCCTGHCPQSIDVPTIMSELADLLK